jgi:regulator of ribosome biosynthesis
VDLPTEKSDVGMLSVLPAEISSLPRSHRLAEKKVDTKWEKFAKTKGITKKKRDRMVS